MIISEPRPVSQMVRLMNGQFRTCKIDAGSVIDWLRVNANFKLHYTNHGPRYIFDSHTIIDGEGYNVMVGNTLTPFFTPKLFARAVVDFTPHVKEAEARDVMVSEILKEKEPIAKVEVKKRKPRTKKANK